MLGHRHRKPAAEPIGNHSTDTRRAAALARGISRPASRGKTSKEKFMSARAAPLQWSGRPAAAELSCNRIKTARLGSAATALPAPRSGLRHARAGPAAPCAGSHWFQMARPRLPSIRRRAEPVESAVRRCATACGHSTPNLGRESPVLAAIGDRGNPRRPQREARKLGLPKRPLRVT
jgi:hypothetical protein